MQGKYLGGIQFICMARGTLQLIAIHMITLHNILEYMQIAFIQTEATAADFNICVILNF
jgi:hypothetical protein